MQTRSARKRQIELNGNSHGKPNGSFSSTLVNGGAEMKEQKQAALLKAIQSTGALLLYLLSSSYIIILNKQLMVDDGFKFPLALTGLSQVAGALAGNSHTTLPFSAMWPLSAVAFLSLNSAHHPALILHFLMNIIYWLQVHCNKFKCASYTKQLALLEICICILPDDKVQRHGKVDF